jgi:hypothetical protein
MPETNYYYDKGHQLRPFTHQGLANPGSLPPDGAVRTAPPVYGQGKWPGFNGSSWTLIDDHRGESGYVDGQPYKITDFGPYPPGWTSSPPPPTEAEVKASAKAALLSSLDGLDRKSTRSLRAVEALRARIANGEAGLEDDLAAELTFLSNLESQAVAKRAELAALGD